MVTQIPINNMVIKATEKKNKDQGFNTLKFKNQKGAIFHNADWIAGVNFDDEAYDEDGNGDPKDKQDINEDKYN
jgi:hypothetical protein